MHLHNIHSYNTGLPSTFHYNKFACPLKQVLLVSVFLLPTDDDAYRNI